ncbi:(2Fe-2S)-binding protein [Streptomyces ureilyticus]|uniref:(2Fe-2S)-binding protein n=1 Tax=Streptomyces ureilyticus TaxID=1775131 RepID=A0ABX0E322_9ACTN|nr:(2Fe-2S)-binding protein [Streptomyces ureilyticus]NGO47947.1 (2Fe-2S)-binding protein [Streptomyces ureilyticus]
MGGPHMVVTEAYDRLTEAYPYLGITELGPEHETPRDGGWFAVDQLAAGGPGLDAFLAWDDAQVLKDYGQQARPDVIASFGLHRYAWPACLLFTVPWFLLRRVPRIPVENVSYQRELGRMTVRVGAFACLPDDPAATLPGARVVPDEEALREEVRTAVAEHLEPVLGGFGPRMRRRGRALWGTVTDDLVESLHYIGQQLGEEQRVLAELERLLPGTTRPYVGTAAFRQLTGPCGESLPTRDRASCCFFYTIEPEDTCANCPRNSDELRIEKLTAQAAG